jgi:hypothetical protein
MRDDHHFLLLFDLIGVLRKSPYHSTFGPVIVIVPKTTGIGRPSSATGTSKSSSAAGFGAGGFGARAALMNAETTRTRIALNGSMMGLLNKSVCRQTGFFAGYRASRHS